MDARSQSGFISGPGFVLLFAVVVMGLVSFCYLALRPKSYSSTKLDQAINAKYGATLSSLKITDLEFWSAFEPGINGRTIKIRFSDRKEGYSLLPDGRAPTTFELESARSEYTVLFYDQPGKVSFDEEFKAISTEIDQVVSDAKAWRTQDDKTVAEMPAKAATWH
jgi:hypothetical protein